MFGNVLLLSAWHFLSVAMLDLAVQFLSSASLCWAFPLPIPAFPRVSLANRRCSIRSCSFANGSPRNSAIRFLCLSLRILSKPLRSSAGRRNAMPLPYLALRRTSIARLRYSAPNLCQSTILQAFPLPFLTTLRLTIAQTFTAQPYPAIARLSLPCSAVPRRCTAIPCLTNPSRFLA